MRKMKRTILLLAAMLAAVSLGGCGRKFDASAYMKSVMDNSYKNDSTEFVAQKVGTAEQAQELYEQGIDTELNSLISKFDAPIPDDLKEEFREVLKDVFKSVKYTVGEAVKKDDSYEVEVRYQKMDIFGPALEIFYAASEKRMSEIAEEVNKGGEQPSDEELGQQRCEMLKDAIQEALADVTYEDEESMVVHINLVDDVWTPDQDDVYELEMSLLDIDVATEKVGS